MIALVAMDAARSPAEVVLSLIGCALILFGGAYIGRFVLDPEQKNES